MHRSLDNSPLFPEEKSEIIKDVNQILREDVFLIDHSKIEDRYKQISITPNSGVIKKAVFRRVLEILTNHIKKIKIVQSDHSIDILDIEVSKLHVAEALRSTLHNRNQNILVIGDQGQFGGNDFDLLNSPYSLSVNKISSSLHTCWNLSPVGLRGARAALSILKALNFENTTFQLDIDYLNMDTNK